MRDKIGMLIVGKDEKFAWMMKHYFESPGIEVTHASDKDNAFGVFVNNPNITVVLMNYDLGDGVNTLELAKSFVDLRKKTKIVAISDDFVEREKLLGAGCVYGCVQSGIIDLMVILAEVFQKEEEADDKKRNAAG
ncbi:MAG: hypothetical protein PHN74_01130 [Candidatus Pacebacteria bacterium]|nr:hypothetical protein [Candidatus Paceibacterota bacterium]